MPSVAEKQPVYRAIPDPAPTDSPVTDTPPVVRPARSLHDQATALCAGLGMLATLLDGVQTAGEIPAVWEELERVRIAWETLQEAVARLEGRADAAQRARVLATMHHA